MPLQNKVDPFGVIQAAAMRGLFMGNRGGRMHDPATRGLNAGKRHVSRQWITCLTDFKGRERVVMGPGYTELFFLDEVVALAAGHRPCAECRRADFRRFCSAIGDAPLRAPDLDRALHGERRGARLRLGDLREALPDGAMIGAGGTAHAKRRGMALPFGFDGYGPAVAWEHVAKPDALVLTPATSLKALRRGYAVQWHPSARA